MKEKRYYVIMFMSQPCARNEYALVKLVFAKESPCHDEVIPDSIKYCGTQFSLIYSNSNVHKIQEIIERVGFNH